MSGSAMPISLLEWKSVSKASLRGFAKVRVGRSLTIRDVAVHAKNGRRWAQLPSRPQVGPDGTVRRDDSGKIMYSPVLEWLDRETADRFSEGVISAIDREHPGATDL